MVMDKEVLKEHRIHGTHFFPLGIYKNQHGPGEMVLDFHWHDEWEFFLITQGNGLFQVDDKQQSLTKNQAIFSQNRAIHGGRPLLDDGCSYQAVVFHPRFLADHAIDPIQIEYIEPFLTGKKKFPDFILNQTTAEKQIILLLKDIFQSCEQKPLGYELHAKGNLLLIWSVLLSNGNFSETKNPLRQQEQVAKIKLILTFIHENYQKKITVPQMAQNLGMSESYFCRFFKRMMYMTPMEYIQRYRIRIAANELSCSSKHIIETAYNCGFDNLSYFNQIFKKYMACTPSKYRSL